MRWKSVDQSGAWFSECDQYRYLLWRELHGSLNLFPMDTKDRDCTIQTGGSVLFIMLNPSTADATQNDPTIRRCIDYGTRWGFSQLLVANIFGWRSTDPTVLEDLEDPVGPANDKIIKLAATTADRVICAWGNDGVLNHRGSAVLDMIREAGVTPHCLNQNQGGQPVHPLYQPKALQGRELTNVLQH